MVKTQEKAQISACANLIDVSEVLRYNRDCFAFAKLAYLPLAAMRILYARSSHRKADKVIFANLLL